MRKSSRYLIPFIMLTSLIGCSTTSNSTAMPSPYTPDISSPEGFPTATKTARPSFTPRPSQTPDLTQTAIRQDQSTARAAEQTLVAQYPRVCSNTYAPPEFSPDGLWMKEFCYSEEDQSPILTLSNKDNQVLWKLIYRDFTSYMFPEGGLAIVHWSNDRKYAYFKSYTGGDGGECFLSFLKDGSGLFRLDLHTGNVNTILPSNDDFAWYTFSFSPTDRRLVYGVHSRDLKILDMTSGQLTELVPVKNFEQSGDYEWSPDGLQFVYSTSTDENQEITYSLRLVDAQLGSERILLESSEYCYATRAWTNNTIIMIESYDKNYNQTLIEYDLNTNLSAPAHPPLP